MTTRRSSNGFYDASQITRHSVPIQSKSKSAAMGDLDDSENDEEDNVNETNSSEDDGLGHKDGEVGRKFFS